jgi:hypothetical protein
MDTKKVAVVLLVIAVVFSAMTVYFAYRSSVDPDYRPVIDVSVNLPFIAGNNPNGGGGGNVGFEIVGGEG